MKQKINSNCNFQASKESVLQKISTAECVHLATHVSWKLSAIVLSPGEVLDSQASKTGNSRFFPGGQSNGSEGSQDACDEEGSEVLFSQSLSALFLIHVSILY